MNQIVVFLAFYLFAFSGNGQSAPKKLAIYYGWPSVINGSANNLIAAEHFEQYDLIVWGDSVEQVTHGNYINSKDVLERIYTDKPDIEVFGYLNLGNNAIPDTNDLKARILQMKEFGFNGVLFDLCGYTWGCSRERLRTAVNYAHFKSLKVIGNTDFPEQILQTAYDPFFNPYSLPTPFYNTDFYLFESFLVIKGRKYNQSEMAYWFQTKSPKIFLEKEGIISSINILSTNTSDSTYQDAQNNWQVSCIIAPTENDLIDSLFKFSWYGAWLDGHYATAWSECNYSADGILPYRTRPSELNAGTLTSFPRYRSWDNLHYTKETTLGQIWINQELPAGGFSPNGMIKSIRNGNWSNFKVWDRYTTPNLNMNVTIGAKTKITQAYSPSKIDIKPILTENDAVLELNGVIESKP